MTKFRGQNVFGNRHFSITPHDSNDVSFAPCVVVAATAGDVAVEDIYGTAITYTLPAGGTVPVMVQKVLATGTTATVAGIK